jgi:hypothetical protein
VAAPSGTHFHLDYSDMVGSGANWQTMSNFMVMGAMSEMTDTPGQGTHARFYRAVMGIESGNRLAALE